MNLTPEQDVLLHSVKIATDAYRDAQRGVEPRMRLLVQQELATHRDAMDRELRRAFDSGIPKRQIRLYGMGTSAPAPLDDSLKRTERFVVPAETKSDFEFEKFVLADEGESVLVSLMGADFEKACADEGWDVAEAESLLLGGLFANIVSGAGGRAITTTIDFLPQYGRRHPVAAWIERNSAEILAWVDTQAVTA